MIHLLALLAVALAADSVPPPKPIQDNSFLIGASGCR